MSKPNLPEGWNEVNLGDVLDYEQPTNYIVSSEDYNDRYKVPVLTAGKSFLLGYTNETEGVYTKLPVIIFDDFTTASKYVTFPFKVKSSAMKLLTPKNKDVDLKYIFWLMQTIKVDSSTHKRYYLSKYRNIRIALPPLSTQKKIVSVLEKAEKTKEWRKESDKLTDNYLNSVFLEMFGDPIKNPYRWDKVELGKLCRIRRGASPRPIKDFLGGTVPWIKIGDGTKGNELYIEETKEKIIQEGVKKSVLLKKGSLIFANCGVSLGFARILKIDGCIHDGWLSFEEIDPLLNNIYLLKSINLISNYFRNIAPDGTQPNLNTTIMKKFEIQLPPIDIQNKFADFVLAIEQIKESQQKSNYQIDNLFNTLMQKAFRGELVC